MQALFATVRLFLQILQKGHISKANRTAKKAGAAAGCDSSGPVYVLLCAQRFTLSRS
jgi:hypothetical protein